MKIPNMHEVIWLSPPNMGGENISSITLRYMEMLRWKQGDNPALIYVGSESQLERLIEIRKEHPHVPVILNFWGWMPERFISPDWRRHYIEKIKLIGEYATKIVVPNSSVAEQLRICGIGGTIEISPPGVDTIELNIAKYGSKKYVHVFRFVASVGRLVPHKNFKMVINAMKGIDAKYSIIGTGEQKEELEKHAKECGVELLLSPGLDDLAKGEILSLARAVVVPSLYEGFGLPIIEAITVGTPVLAYDLPVYHELFGDCLEYFHDETELANKIRKCLDDQEYREKIILKEAILGLRYSALRQSLQLNSIFIETIATELKATMRTECSAGNNTLEDAYNMDAIMDSEFFDYRIDPNTALFFFRRDPLVKNLSPGNVLDVGSSTGIFAIYMAAQGHDVQCIDIAEKYLEIVKRLAEKNGLSKKIKTHICNAEFLDSLFKEHSFDNVWAGEIIEHFKDNKKLIQQIMRVLKPGGRLLLTVPFKNACFDSFHEACFNTEEDIKKITSEFPNFEFKEVYRIGSPGGQHNNWFAWGIKKEL